MHREPSSNRTPIREWWRRLDRVAGDMNAFLLVIALGLATLDFTFMVTLEVVDNLPPITHEAPASSP